jgi:hypothetical protein
MPRSYILAYGLVGGLLWWMAWPIDRSQSAEVAHARSAGAAPSPHDSSEAAVETRAARVPSSHRAGASPARAAGVTDSEGQIGSANTTAHQATGGQNGMQPARSVALPSGGPAAFDTGSAEARLPLAGSEPGVDGDDAAGAPGSAESEAAQEQRSRLEQEWNAQPHDPARTQELRSYLHQTAGALQLPPEVVQASDCGSSVCKVRLSFATIEQASQFEQAAQNPDFRYELKATHVPSSVVPGSAPLAAPPGVPTPEGAPGAPELPAPPAKLPPVEVEALLELTTAQGQATPGEDPAP